MKTGVQRSTGILPVSSRAILALLFLASATGKMPVGLMGRMPMLRFSHTF
jgi:hypothetical protein